MEDRRRTTTVRQMELMMEFLEHHSDLALGRVRSKESRAVAARLWREYAITLNAAGPARTGKEWSKVWNDYKCRVKAKLVSINTNRQATGSGPSTAAILTPLEEKAASIIGRDVGPLADVRQDQFASYVGDGVVVDIVNEQSQQQAGIASPVLLLNVNEADVEPEPAASPVAVEVLATSPVPSLTGQSPSRQRIRRVREPRRLVHASRQLTPQMATLSGRGALEQSREIILQIEKLRAEAALNNSQAACTIAGAIRLLAESIDRYCQRCFQEQSQQQP